MYGNAKAKCFRGESEQKWTCERREHSCFRKIVSGYHHPARRAYRQSARASRLAFVEKVEDGNVGLCGTTWAVFANNYSGFTNRRQVHSGIAFAVVKFPSQRRRWWCWMRTRCSKGYLGLGYSQTTRGQWTAWVTIGVLWCFVALKVEDGFVQRNLLSQMARSGIQYEICPQHSDSVYNKRTAGSVTFYYNRYVWTPTGAATVLCLQHPIAVRWKRSLTSDGVITTFRTSAVLLFLVDKSSQPRGMKMIFLRAQSWCVQAVRNSYQQKYTRTVSCDLPARRQVMERCGQTSKGARGKVQFPFFFSHKHSCLLEFRDEMLAQNAPRSIPLFLQGFTRGITVLAALWAGRLARWRPMGLASEELAKASQVEVCRWLLAGYSPRRLIQVARCPRQFAVSSFRDRTLHLVCSKWLMARLAGYLDSDESLDSNDSDDIRLGTLVRWTFSGSLRWQLTGGSVTCIPIGKVCLIWM